MNFSIESSLPVLRNTPDVLYAITNGLNEEWTTPNEGGETWSVYDIVGHLIHGEKTDWIARLEKVLSDNDKHFEPFDRFAQFEESKGKTLNDLLAEFKEAREHNLKLLEAKGITENDFDKTGIHPSFGEVKLSQLLATYVAHDLNHIAQIARVMAKQYKEATGPWIEYLRILKS